MLFRCISIVAMLAITVQSFAAEPDASPWSGKAHLGYLATSGNTDNSSLNSGFEIGYEVGKWQHLLDAQAINSTEDGSTTAEAYTVGWKSERNLSEKRYLFGKLDWRKDRFSGYDTQFSQAVGYGRRLINTGAHELNLELGIGARQSDPAVGDSEKEAIGSAGLDYTYKFSETASFNQAFTVEYGNSNTFSTSVSSVSAQLLGHLALVASYTIKTNSDVPPLTDKTDTFSALSLEYVF